MNAVETRIRYYVLETFMFTDDEDQLTNDASFLEEGIVDSTGVLELVLFVEETFGITVNDEEIVPDNFDSVEKLTRYVRIRSDGATPQSG